jgi:serine/threonine protein kinase
MDINLCPTCHAPIPANAPGGFCPACLLRDAEEPTNSGHGVPPLEEIAAAFPQWEVLGLIGRGGMGFVYKVRQPSLDRTVALKILSPELGRDPAFAERFAREARTLGKLHHPNIVTVFEHGEKDGFFYLLMEYVDGVNLRQAMRAGRFSPEQALSIVPGICDALQAAHTQGIWHRDIKPENILLDKDGKVKIADFGIARIVGDPQRDFTLTRTGNALGSVSYMAPEQHERPHEVDHRADIYSLGVVIYEMLTGELPLGRFPSPSQRAAVDSRIDEIVLKTLEKERELRQQSATEVKTDIHRMMTSAAAPPAPAAIAIQPSGSRTGTIGFWLMIAGVVLPFILWAISERAGELGFLLSLFLIVIAFVLGVLGWKQTLGKVAAISSLLVLMLYLLFLLFTQRSTSPSPSLSTELAPPQGRLLSIEEAKEQFPDVTIGDVFRKVQAAANESDSETFKLHTENLVFCVAPSYDIPGDFMKMGQYTASGTVIDEMAVFSGNLEYLKVANIVDSPDIAIAYAAIRKPDGSLERHAVEFLNINGLWTIRRVWDPPYRASKRIEFKPPNVDAVEIMRTHLGSTTSFGAVEGIPATYDLFGHGKDPVEAERAVETKLSAFHRSLGKFGHQRYLKVISQAKRPELPYMGEDAQDLSAR